MAPNTTVDQCVLAMVDRADGVVAITEGGAARGRVHSLVTAADLAPIFGEQPESLLKEIAHAPSLRALASLNQRARGFLQQQLTTPSSVDWLSQLAHRFDARLFARVIGLLGLPSGGGGAGHEFCWFFFGASGRAESMTALVPQVGLIFGEGSGESGSALDWHLRVLEGLQECGYVGGRTPSSGDTAFACAPLAEWEERFRGFVRDPVASCLYKARPLFDLRPGARATVASWSGSGTWCARKSRRPRASCGCSLTTASPICRPSPSSATSWWRTPGSRPASCTWSAARSCPSWTWGGSSPSTRAVSLGDSTLERFAHARERLPRNESIFREAADSLRVMLYHKARAGIRRQDGGAELDPASLSRYDRQVLKSGFQSILRLLEFTAECRWLETG